MQVLSRDAKACVINNGFTTNYFNLCKGVRQGDSISPYLFNKAIEVLALNIINNNQIKGININNDLIIKICQYADDITVFFSDINSVCLILQIIQDFSLISGLKLNLNKMQGIGIGQNVNFDSVKCQELGIIWSQKIEILLYLFFILCKCY